MMRRGYSFAEVLFAVAVLGIGLIMVAAIFPAAILQTQASAEDTIGAAVTRAGAETIAHSRFMVAGVGGAQGLPSTTAAGKFYSFYDPRITALPVGVGTIDDFWNSFKYAMISEQDPRFGSVAVYSRRGTTPADSAARAELIVVSVRMRADDSFKVNRTPSGTPWGDLDRRTGANPPVAELEPRPVQVILTEGVTQPDTVQIDNITTTVDGTLSPFSVNSNAKDSAVEGAILIISDDRAPAPNAGKANGRIYRLAALKDANTNTWELAPGGAGNDMSIEIGINGQYEQGGGDDTNEQLPPRPIGAAPNASEAAVAFLIGRGYADPSNPGTPGGGVQALQVLRYPLTLP